jgi:hypothetical protein
MSRTFKMVDYDQALDLTVKLGDCLLGDGFQTGSQILWYRDKARCYLLCLVAVGR